MLSLVLSLMLSAAAPEAAPPADPATTTIKAKKPKKDTAPPKPVSADAVRPTITTVVPVRGKLKK